MNQSEREQTNGNRGRKESEYAWQVKTCDQQKKEAASHYEGRHTCYAAVSFGV